MCLIVFTWQLNPDFPLILAGNRDEFFARPTREAHFWDEHPHIFGGRDLKDGGGWFALDKKGRFAGVTNVREPGQNTNACSRGLIVQAFLAGELPALDFAQNLYEEGSAYNGFNALFGDGETLVYTSNRNDQSPRELPPGHYGLSNHALNTPWPKVVRAVDALKRAPQETPAQLSKYLLGIMNDKQSADDPLLPDTGVGIELERMLSPIFIHGEHYGSRATTVLLRDNKGRLHFTEQRHDPGQASAITQTVLGTE